MTKKELLGKLDGTYKEPQKRIVEQIRSELDYFEDNVELENVDSIDIFFKNGGFREDRLISRDENQILRELQDILAQIRLWVKTRSREVSDETIEYMDRKTQIGMYFFLGIIGLLAVCAIIFLVLHFVIKDGWLGEHGDEIAEAFGTLDFSLGALGFIWERVSDMKKRKVQRRLDAAIESGDTGKFVSATRQVNVRRKIKINQRAGDRSMQIGMVVNGGPPQDNFLQAHGFKSDK